MTRIETISVVLPVRNGARVIAQQLEALSSQHVPRNWEVIVVDNGSTDGTAAVVGKWQDILDVRLVSEPRQGRHYACDTGVAVASGEAILFVDSDDMVAPDYVATMAAALDRYDLVAATIDHERLNRHVDDARRFSALQPGFGYLPFVSGGAMGVRRDLFIEVGGFDSFAKYCEDVDLSWRLQERGATVGAADGAVLHVRLRASDRQGFVQHYRFGRARPWLYKKYRDRGMPRRSRQEVLTDWLMIARSALAGRRRPDERARWHRRAGRAVGYVVGSVRERVFYL